MENWWRIGGELVENWWNLNLNLVEQFGGRIRWKNLVEELVKRGSVEYSIPSSVKGIGISPLRAKRKSICSKVQ